MYFNCYEHPKKLAGERILTRLVRDIVEAPALGLSLADIFALTDDELTTVLRGMGCGSETRASLVGELMGSLDYAVVFEVQASRRPKDPLPPRPVLNWLENVLMGKPAQLRLAYVEIPDVWERAIAERSIGAERAWQIQTVVPPHAVYLAQHSAIRLIKRRNGRYKVVDFFDEARAVKEILEHMNYQRQKILVMCPAHLSAGERESIRQAAVAVLTDSAAERA